MPRYWSVKNKQAFLRAEASEIGNYQSNIMRLNFFGRNNTLPQWKLKFRNRTFPLDQSHILNLLTTSSYTVKPKCFISWVKRKGKRTSTKPCKILSSEGITNGDAFGLKKYSGTAPNDGHFSLFLKVPSSCTIPKTIKQVKIMIKGQLLPKKKYYYGICDSLHDDFVHCSDYEYLQNPGPAIVPFTGVSDDRESCSAFYIRPNTNPQSYCKFAVN
jgi:hypothetical protein